MSSALQGFQCFTELRMVNDSVLEKCCRLIVNVGQGLIQHSKQDTAIAIRRAPLRTLFLGCTRSQAGAPLPTVALRAIEGPCHSPGKDIGRILRTDYLFCGWKGSV